MSAERYHGSAARTLVENLFGPAAKRFRGIGRAFLEGADERIDPRVAALLMEADWAAGERRFDAALQLSREAATIVRNDSAFPPAARSAVRSCGSATAAPG